MGFLTYFSDFLTYFSDFHNDYNAALALRHGMNPLAPAASWIRAAHTSAHQGAAVGGVYYAYAPIFALLLVPLTLLPFYPAIVIWGVCSLVFLVVAVDACLRVAGLRPTVSHLLPVATAVALIRTVRVEYSLGQVDIFPLFVVCAAFWVHRARRSALGAVLLGLACVTKPVLLPFVVFLVWKREFRFAITTIVSFAVLLLAPFVVLGGAALRDQLDIWRYWSNEYAPFEYAYGPKNVLARLFSPKPQTLRASNCERACADHDTLARGGAVCCPHLRCAHLATPHRRQQPRPLRDWVSSQRAPARQPAHRVLKTFPRNIGKY
jgi:hypothetical protein